MYSFCVNILEEGGVVIHDDIAHTAMYPRHLIYNHLVAQGKKELLKGFGLGTLVTTIALLCAWAFRAGKTGATYLQKSLGGLGGTFRGKTAGHKVPLPMRHAAFFRPWAAPQCCHEISETGKETPNEC